MLHDLSLGEEFFSRLVELDAVLARLVAKAGCPRCGGPLHQGNYQRKPRGGLFAAAAEVLTVRHSLCCGWCRKRAMPPSLRFLGRRVYVEAIVLLATMVHQLASAAREARAAVGVPGRTLRRWASWWRDVFPAGPVWALLRARFAPPPPEEAELPASLIARLSAEIEKAAGVVTSDAVCLLAARCLAPGTTSSVPDGSRFVRELERQMALDDLTQKMTIRMPVDIT